MSKRHTKEATRRVFDICLRRIRKLVPRSYASRVTSKYLKVVGTRSYPTSNLVRSTSMCKIELSLRVRTTTKFKNRRKICFMRNFPICHCLMTCWSFNVIEMRPCHSIYLMSWVVGSHSYGASSFDTIHILFRLFIHFLWEVLSLHSRLVGYECARHAKYQPFLCEIIPSGAKLWDHVTVMKVRVTWCSIRNPSPRFNKHTSLVFLYITWLSFESSV